MLIINRHHTHRSGYNQLRGLIDLIEEIPLASRGTMIEIGTFDGDSAEIFSLAFNRVHTVDPHCYSKDYDPGNGITKADILCWLDEKLQVCPNIVFHNMTSIEFAKINIFRPDVVYIDGHHSYESVVEDAKTWLPWIRSGGYFCGHDYLNPDTPGVTKALNELFGEPHKYFCDWSFLYNVEKIR